MLIFLMMTILKIWQQVIGRNIDMMTRDLLLLEILFTLS